MARLGKLGSFALVAGFLAGAGEAPAAPVNLMALGDSITAGVGSSDSQFRQSGSSWSNRGGSGYRAPLNDLLAQTGVYPDGWNFVGTRNAPSLDTRDHPNVPSGTVYPNSWNRHFGIPGIEADNPGAGSVDPTTGHNSKSLVTWVNNYDGATNGRPDVVLLHIGSNSSSNEMTSSPANYTSGTAADAQLYRLLDTMRNDGDFNTANRILVARIIPKASATDLGHIIDYNYSATQGIAGAVAALDPAFQSRIEIVDLFKVAVSDAMLSFLAQQTGEFVDDLRTMIDPGHTGYVDWLDGLDEATHAISGAIARNPYLYTDIVGYTGSDYQYGTTDGTHPSDLGYAVMAWAWGQAIPEPTTLALFALAAAGLASRRRAVRA